MNYEDIQAEYKLFVEHLFAVQGYLELFLKDGNKFLQDYLKSKVCDKNFAEKFDEELLKLGFLHKSIDDTIELLSSISISEIEYLELNNIVKFKKYINNLEDCEQDIYVDLNHPLCWKSRLN